MSARLVTRLLALVGTVALAGGTALPSSLAQTPASTGDGGFSKTVSVTRTNLVGGKDVVVDQRTVTVRVNRTRGLKDRDGLSVSWSGAHPTSGLVSDINSSSAVQEEYPVVLLQCRGIDSPTVPAAQRIRPETCFTQAPQERYVEERNTLFPPWRLDRYAPLPERAIKVDVPQPAPTSCPRALGDVVQRYVPFVAASGRSYPVGSNGCAGLPPEMSEQSTLGLPSNSTYGITALDGRGSARFDVRTTEDNASLGCSSTVPCSLVVVPVMGISCDVGASELPAADRPTDPDEADAANRKCLASGHFKPGEFNTSPLNEDLSVAGALWWSGSNWRQRITVPLSFAVGPEACDVTSTTAPIYFYGSELLSQATAQWAPTFCLDKSRTPFRHVQTGEPQARNLLRSGGIQAAFHSRLDASFRVPTVTAPVAMTGFAIGYTVDGTDQNPVGQLRLTPRLLAKLLTLSYPMLPDIRRSYTALSSNPINIAADPEFQALNPTVPHDVRAGISASTLLALSSDSDVMWALTSYLQADPDARAFLDGTPDPWGMKVNPSYKGIALPVDNWPLLDTFITPLPINPCLKRNPVPFLGLAASPTQRLATIALDMQYALAPSQVICQQSPLGELGDKLVAIGRQQGGYHFLLGVMSLPDARRFGVSTASLLSSTSSTAPTRFTDETGRTFVAPDDDSLRAAADLLVADPAHRTWSLPADVLRTKGPRAYPGTMPVFASVPLRGLPPTQAAAYQRFLAFAAGPGQVRGVGIGELPDGYLPLTATNGLGALADYSLRAAKAVGAQSGVVPELVAPPVAPVVTPPSPSGPTPAVTASSPAGGPPPTALPVVRPGALPPPSTPQLPTFPTPATTPQPQAFSGGITAGAPLGLITGIVPLLLLVGLFAGGFAWAISAAAMPTFAPITVVRRLVRGKAATA